MEEVEDSKGSGALKWIITSFVIFIIILGTFAFFVFRKTTCGDGTSYDECSLTKPYFCEEGILIEQALICGCPQNFSVGGETCFLEYKTGQKSISLAYKLNGDMEGVVDFVVYGGFYNYSTRISRFLEDNGNGFSRKNFKLGIINNPLQREMLMPLVVQIQNLEEGKRDQAMIAINLVQTIPYDFAKDNLSIWQQALSLKYPYEVIYDGLGVCGEKVDLLSILLKEIGYGVAIFYFPEKNHEGVGIKCSPIEDYRDSGYCYVETTSPSAINDYGVLQSLGGSEVFEVIEISDGRGF